MRARKPLTALALPRIVTGLRGRGITPVKLSDLLAADSQQPPVRRQMRALGRHAAGWLV